MKSLLLLVVAFLTVCANAPAADYQFHPTSILHLTGGFDPNDPANPPLPCVDPGGDVIDGNPRSVNFDSMLVTDNKDLFRAFGVDAALSARYQFISARDTFHLSDESALHEDSLTWTLRALAVYEADRLPNPTLNAKAQQLQAEIANGDAHQFYERCGTEFVSQQIRVQLVNALFTVHHISSSRRTELMNTFNAGVSGPQGSADLSLSFRNFLTEASKSGTVTLSFYALGGDGISKIVPDLIVAGDKLDKVQESFKTYVANMTHENAPPTYFTTTKFTRFGLPEPNPIGEISPTLLDIFYDYEDYSSVFLRLGNILRNSSTDYPYLSTQQLAQYETAHKEVGSYVEALRKVAIDCLKAKSPTCTGPGSRPAPVEWPRNPSPACNDWEDGRCVACTVTLVWRDKVAGQYEDFSCPKMAPNAPVKIHFSGYLPVSSPNDNKIWNAWVTAHLYANGGDAKGATTCHGCTSYPAPAQWTHLDAVQSGKTNQAGMAGGRLSIDQCQTGPSPATCSTSDSATAIEGGATIFLVTESGIRKALDSRAKRVSAH